MSISGNVEGFRQQGAGSHFNIMSISPCRPLSSKPLCVIEAPNPLTILCSKIKLSILLLCLLAYSAFTLLDSVIQFQSYRMIPEEIKLSLSLSASLSLFCSISLDLSLALSLSRSRSHEAPLPHEIGIEQIDEYTMSSLEDVWSDADMMPVIEYLRSNRNLSFPRAWKRLIEI